MSCINEEELDGVLGTVFARHLVPFELRLIIWELAYGNCAGCGMLYPKSSLHGCAVYGYAASCPNCIPSHFCISINSTPQKPLNNLIPDLLRLSLPGLPRLDVTSLSCDCDSSRKEYVLTGFKKAKIDSIREALEFLRDVVGRLAYVYSHIGLQGMKIAYFEGVFE
jgi:hypothetical protein